MKKIIKLIACVIMLLSVFGCSAQKMWQEQYDLGVRYLNEGNYEEAIIAFTEAIKIEPKKYEAYLERANAYLKIGDEENLEYARADFEKVIEIDETVAETYGGLAEIYVSKNEPEKALEILENAEEKVGNASKDLYENKDVVLYSPEEQITINLKELKTYKEEGWYTEPVVIMYAADGRTRITLESEVEAYKNVGWYTEPVKTTNLKSILTKGYWGIHKSHYTADDEIWKFNDDGTATFLGYWSYCGQYADETDLREFEEIFAGLRIIDTYNYSVDEEKKRVKIDGDYREYLYDEAGDYLYCYKDTSAGRRKKMCRHYLEKPTVWEFERGYKEYLASREVDNN